VLKARKPSVKMIAVEPKTARCSGGQPGPHKIQGIGAGFIPDILDRSAIDEVVTISNETAFETARAAARLEGIPGGISSGAAIAAAFEVGARPEMAGKQIVTIIPSFAERYLSTALFEGLYAVQYRPQPVRAVGTNRVHPERCKSARISRWLIHSSRRHRRDQALAPPERSGLRRGQGTEPAIASSLP
jgi:hypothetical protein